MLEDIYWKRSAVLAVCIFIISAGLMFCTRQDRAITQQALPADSTIENNVQEALLAETQLEAENVKIEVKDGIVTLTGEINDLLSKRRATELSQAIKGGTVGCK